MPVKASPCTIRAANIFLVLPEAGRPWWFRDPVFWTEYLDMMRARGSISSTSTAMYVPAKARSLRQSRSLVRDERDLARDRGPEAEREANVAMLNQVIRWRPSRHQGGPHELQGGLSP